MLGAAGLLGFALAAAAPLAGDAANAVPPPDPSAAERLMQAWPGSRDSSEQVIVDADADRSPLQEQADRRVRTDVARVNLPWLGPRVLYLEEYLYDDPDVPRRQVLLQIEPSGEATNTVRARLYTFVDPQRWRQLHRRPQRVQALQRSDIEAAAGCDLLLLEEGNQFRGGTRGHDCRDSSRGGERYVDYRMVIGEDLYWYRRRIFAAASDELRQEIVAFNWFELNEARLFSCRVEWSSSGKLSDRHMLLRLDLHDQGGRGKFTTPDGRKLELALHSQDWPFAGDRDVLILVLQDEGAAEPLASAWTELDSRQISIDMGWITVHCGPLVPETDALAS